MLSRLLNLMRTDSEKCFCFDRLKTLSSRQKCIHPLTEMPCCSQKFIHPLTETPRCRQKFTFSLTVGTDTHTFQLILLKINLYSTIKAVHQIVLSNQATV